MIDGANRFQRIKSVTLPSIAPTISIMLIMQIGRLMSLGYEKIILLYNGSTYETADVISTYVYRRGILSADFSYSTAVRFESLPGLQVKNNLWLLLYKQITEIDHLCVIVPVREKYMSFHHIKQQACWDTQHSS